MMHLRRAYEDTIDLASPFFHTIHGEPHDRPSEKDMLIND